MRALWITLFRVTAAHTLRKDAMDVSGCLVNVQANHRRANPTMTER